MALGTRLTLDALVGQLRAAHGDRLLAVLLYGSTANDPAATHGHSVVVIVRTLDVQAMRAGGAIAQAWEEAGNPAPLVLTGAEWMSSVDVFAIEHADIADRHRILYVASGFDPIGRRGVRYADLRQQLEYELLALLLAVRSAIALAGRDVKAQRAIMAENASRAAALMRAVLRLERRPLPDDLSSVCGAVAQLAGFDAGPFVAALGERRGRKLSEKSVEAALSGFHAGLATLMTWVDARPVASEKPGDGETS